MSYVQGTVVRLRADFTKTDTGDADSPAEVVLTIEDPAGEVTIYTLSDGQVQQDDTMPNRYTYMLNTMPAAGTWRYQFESIGPTAVVGRKSITVVTRVEA